MEEQMNRSLLSRLCPAFLAAFTCAHIADAATSPPPPNGACEPIAAGVDRPLIQPLAAHVIATSVCGQDVGLIRLTLADRRTASASEEFHCGIAREETSLQLAFLTVTPCEQPYTSGACTGSTGC